MLKVGVGFSKSGEAEAAATEAAETAMKNAGIQKNLYQR